MFRRENRLIHFLFPVYFGDRLLCFFPLLANILTTFSGEQRQPVIETCNFFTIEWIDPMVLE